ALQIARRRVGGAETSVPLLRGRLNAAAHSQVAKMAQRASENIGLLGGIIQQGERRMLQLAQRLGRLQVTKHAAAVMLEDFRRGCDKLLGRPLHGLDGAADGREEISNLAAFTGHEIDNAVEE